MKIKSIRIESCFETWEEFYNALKDGKKINYIHYENDEHINTEIFMDKDEKSIYYLKHNWKLGIDEKVILGNMYEPHDDKSFYSLNDFTLIDER